MIKIDFSKENLEFSIDSSSFKDSNSNTKDSYEKETLYQQRAFENFINKITNPDLSEEQNSARKIDQSKQPTSFYLNYQHFGRINSNLLSIEPKQSGMVNLGNNNSSVRVLDFVADAYEDFSVNFLLFLQTNRVPKTNIFYQLFPRNNIPTLNELFSEYSEDTYSILLDFIQITNTHKEIYDFSSFISVFKNFIDFITPDRLLNKSSFSISNSSSPKISGLMLDLFLADVNDDVFKYENFINNDYFSCYVDYLKQYGFIITKEVPWRIVADLNSLKMKNYYDLRVKQLIDENNLNINFKKTEDLYSNLFDGINKIYYYNIINNTELEEFKKLIGTMYNAYVNYKPENEKIVVIKNNAKFLIKNETSEKNQISIDRYLAEPITEDFIKLYVFVKAREFNMAWSQRKFLDVTSKVYNLSKTLDVETAMAYLQREINRNQISFIKNRNFKF